MTTLLVQIRCTAVDCGYACRASHFAGPQVIGVGFTSGAADRCLLDHTRIVRWEVTGFDDVPSEGELE